MRERDLFIPMLVRGETVRALVVGYGRVGKRKTGKVLDGGGSVLAIDPQAEPACDNRLEVRKESYRPETLAGRTHLFACTDDPALNERLCNEAVAAGLLTNDATASAGSGFILPAMHTARNFTIFVSGGGINPSAALFLKRLLAKTLDLPTLEAHIDRLDAARERGDSAELTRLSDPDSFLPKAAGK